MRHAIRLLGRLDEEFPHFADIMSLRVVRLCAHQLCCRQHRSPHFTSQKQKTRVPNSSAAGKSLITMDLPSALNAPSPACFAAHRSRRETSLGYRTCNSAPRFSFQIRTTGPSLVFLGKLHRRDGTPFVVVSR